GTGRRRRRKQMRQRCRIHRVIKRGGVPEETSSTKTRRAQQDADVGGQESTTSSASGMKVRKARPGCGSFAVDIKLDKTPELTSASNPASTRVKRIKLSAAKERRCLTRMGWA